ncbi:protein of unknown function [Paraburkholderia kururiensis]
MWSRRETLSLSCVRDSIPVVTGAHADICTSFWIPNHAIKRHYVLFLSAYDKPAALAYSDKGLSFTTVVNNVARKNWQQFQSRQMQQATLQNQYDAGT